MNERVSGRVVTGRLGQKTPQGESQVDAGATMSGKGADIPMEVSSVGTADLQTLVTFVVEATRPFSSHATIKWHAAVESHFSR